MAVGSGRLALVVEDLPSHQREVRKYLEQHRFKVETASDHASAVRALEKSVPQLVCVNMRLPRESGLELCEHIRVQRKLSFVPILVMSERATPEDMAHAEIAGANAFL